MNDINLAAISDVSRLLRGVDVFAELQEDDLERVVSVAQRQEHKAGEVVLKRGAVSDGFRVAESGVFEVCQTDPETGIEQVIGEVQPGQVFGEVGLLLNEPRTATVRAREDGSTLYFDRMVFEQLVREHPPVSLALARVLAHRLATSNRARRMQFEQIAQFRPVAEVIRLLPLRVILKHKVLPLTRTGQAVRVGIVDPGDLVARNTVAEFLPDFQIRWACISQPDFEIFRDQQLWDYLEQVAGNLGEEGMPALRYVGSASKMGGTGKAAETLDELIRSAVDAGASDIHFEPGLNAVTVRSRIDGRLVKLGEELDLADYPALVSRLKVLSNLDISERRLPQDGDLHLRYRNRSVDLRISTLPTPPGESLVVRILDREQRQLDFDNLFLTDEAVQRVAEMFLKPSGLVLVTGPTGAGKTSTLYAGIRMRLRRTPNIKLVTAEDPIEYHLQGATQVQVNPVVGLTFARILRSLLRQDPDVMLVGEIRDEESMEIALEAALTGHLVLTSLHTGSALESISRLRQRGAEQYVIASAVRGVVSQILLPRVCSVCAAEAPLDESRRQSLASAGVTGLETGQLIKQAQGCDHCRMTGRKGRVGVFEILSMSGPLQEVIERGGSQADMARALTPETYLPMGTYAGHLIRQGVVDPQDVQVQFPGTRVSGN